MVNQKFNDMIQEELTQMANSAGEYLAPSVMVVEIKAWRVMCQSPVTTGIDRMEDEEGEW